MQLFARFGLNERPYSGNYSLPLVSHPLDRQGMSQGVRQGIRRFASWLGNTLGSALLCVCMALPALQAHAQDASAHKGTIDKAKALLQAQDAQGAYDLLKPLEPDLAGNTRFDYLLGVAAMDTQRPVEALFALERAVSVDPDDPLIRAAYATALLGANEVDEAREQAALARAAVGTTRDVPGVQQDLEEFASALARPGFGQTTDFRGYVGVSLGYDSNVHNATDDIIIAGLATETADFFATFLGGGSVSHPLRRDLAVNAAISGNHRVLESEHSSETTSFQANTDLTYTRDNAQWSMGAFAQHFAVHMDANKNAFGLVGRAKFTLRDCVVISRSMRRFQAITGYLSPSTAQRPPASKPIPTSHTRGIMRSGRWVPSHSILPCIWMQTKMHSA